MSSPIDCSSTGPSSGASSPASDGLDGRRPAASTAAHDTHVHDDREHDGLGSDGNESEGPGEDDHVRIGSTNHDSRNQGRGEHGRGEQEQDGHGDETINREALGGVAGEKNTGEKNTGEKNTGEKNTGEKNTGEKNTGEKNTGEGGTGGKVIDEETTDEKIADKHTGTESTDDGGIGYEEVEIGFLPRDNNARRGAPVCFLTLVSFLFALAAVIYSAREPLPVHIPQPTQMPAWLANLGLARHEVLVPLDVAGSVQTIVETYEPFIGDDLGLLAARSWPCGDAPSLMSRAIPGADFERLGGMLTFFDNMSRNVTEFCATVDDTHSTLSGDTSRSHKEEIEALCRPLVKFGRSASAAYIEVVYGLTGPYKETRWMQQVRTEVLDLANAARGISGDAGPVQTPEDGADYIATNASTSDRLRHHIGSQGSWQVMNSRFKDSLLELYRSCMDVERAWAALTPVARSFIAGTSASAAHDAATGLLHAQVAGEWLLLESAMAVVRELALAAEDGIKSLIMAQFRLQELHDNLGRVKRGSLVARHADDRREVKARFTLADPSALRDMILGTAEWLEAQTADLHGVTSVKN